MLEEYCIYTRDLTPEHIQGLRNMGVLLDIHANRTRFKLDSTVREHYMFYFAHSDIVYRVADITGQSC